MITQLKIAVHRLKELKGFVMPGDISKVTPLAYNDYLSQRRTLHYTIGSQLRTPFLKAPTLLMQAYQLAALVFFC